VRNFRRLDGYEFPTTVLLTNMEILGNKVVQATVRDITEQKKSEEAILQAQQLQKDIIDFLPDPTFVIDSEGAVLAWKWVRYFSPLLNTYAFIFLVGGAIYSAIKYYKQTKREALFKGNIFIAIGGLLPGIGGTFTRMGYVEVLFMTEILGLFLIYVGYKIVKSGKRQLSNKN